MPEPWKIQYSEKGIYLPSIDLWMDPHRSVDFAYVSHAHFDHMAAHRQVLTSEATAQLMNKRMPGERKITALPFGQTYQLRPDTRIRLHPAGHILGSAQLWIEREGSSLLYSGDFKLRPGRSAEVCEPVHADVLIMETTYGLPQYIFPPTDEVLADILRFCQGTLDDGEIPVLLGYSLGKSQELLAALFAAGIPVMLHNSVYEMTRIYESLGFQFPPYSKFKSEEARGHVVIFPPNASGSLSLKKAGPLRSAAITGWALASGAIFRYQCDAVFPLSDHAGYDDLLEYVRLVNPRTVYTLHGFAREFAATLRERGVEAWSLTSDDQLELILPKSPLPASPPGTQNSESQTQNVPLPRPPPHRSLPGTQNPKLETQSPVLPHSFKELCLVLDACVRISSKNEKVRLLSTYFLKLERANLALAVTFASGRAFSSREEKKLGVGSMILRRAVLQLTGLNRGDYRTVYLRYQDAGMTLQDLMQGHGSSAGLTLQQLQATFDSLSQITKPEKKIGLLKDLFLQLSPQEVKWAAKLITGDLRAGLKEGLVEAALAQAFAEPLDEIILAHMITGDLAETSTLAISHRLDSANLQLFRPIKPMLASPEPSAESIMERSGGKWWVEDKFDGIRCQLHKKDDRVELYTRDLKRVSDTFPEIINAAKTLPFSCVLDGELLAFSGGKALPFSSLQKRLGRKEADLFLQEQIPLAYMAFDCMSLEGETLLHLPWRERRHALGRCLGGTDSVSSVLQIGPASPASDVVTIDALFLRARAAGNEGLIIKDPDSRYTPGRRGLSWLKLKKAYATLDVVVTAVEVGHGKRKEFLSDYTFALRGDNGELLTIGKAYSGLTDAELGEMTEKFKSITTEIVRGRLYKVQPEVIIEVAFDSIQPSGRHASGLALRFPRILRIRDDKTATEIDTLAHARRLAGVV